eukprot:TRINITY_DN211_c0_g2_i1.p1 TRINITY_DN211_c0_g2~~TRINITY_DN211_c0_g2_i1.p1  ORF type:complete len:633 (-),score=130.70 TRINITY_DN211_c0_g2_i1:224-2122(-)
MEEVELKEIVVGAGRKSGDSNSSDEEMYKENIEGFKSAGLGAELVWRDVCFSVGKGKMRKNLLNGVSGRAQGELVAIMGGSGAGKTTLLNVLAKRNLSGNTTKTGGQLLLNGSKYSKKILKRCAGYVMQDDVLFSHFTVRETLNYAAKLKLSGHLNSSQIRERVNEVIGMIGLQPCLDTIVGDPLNKGISGGERKRLCIAIELLSRPGLLFLDEPTSGLDSATAASLIGTLKKLSHKGTTVLCTVHQPQARVFFMFDKFLLLHKGQTVYFGPPSHAVDFYSNAGLPVPSMTNPADHFLDCLTVDRSADEDNSEVVARNAENLKEAYKQLGQKIDALPPTKQKVMPRTSWLRQFFILLHRATVSNIRNYWVFVACMGQAIIMGLLIGFVWRSLELDIPDMNRRLPLLFFVAINQGIFGIFIMVNLFPAERVVVLRERASGMYYASAYFLAKSVAELPNTIIPSFVVGTTVYWLTGLKPDPGHFFIFLGILQLCAMAASSLGLAVSAWCKTATLASAVVPLFVELFRLFGAFFVPPSLLPGYFTWIDAVSFTKYSFLALAQNELHGLELACVGEPPAVDPVTNATIVCPVNYGTQLLEDRDMQRIPIWACALVLVGLILGMRIIGYLGIRFVRK